MLGPMASPGAKPYRDRKISTVAGPQARGIFSRRISIDAWSVPKQLRIGGGAARVIR
jgi:hypothetical protein